jgi:hypothetical protein
MENWKQFYTSRYGRTTSTQTWWISDHGRVKITNTANDKVRYPKLSVTANNRTNGYLAISINNAPEKYVHRLVARYFLENPENKRTVNHIDADKRNNHVDNLEWATDKEQYDHMISIGSKPPRKQPEEPKMIKRYKLMAQWKDVPEWAQRVIDKLIQGYTYKQVAEELNVNQHTLRTRMNRLKKQNQ